ncbi:hypothetical protein EG329_010853 [Mollisiaceae sp. DMI_Dod_QoI]|nr:hypothetical protein EG329_010853 [Helotiales sp. DMI_Dod_QoI]
MLEIGMLIANYGSKENPAWTLLATMKIMEDMPQRMYAYSDIQPLTHAGTCTSPPTSWALIEEWIRTCNESHSLCSAAIHNNRNWYPTRLLHINETSDQVNIIITADVSMAEGEKYMTLSHCWGKEQQPLRLLKNNMHELKKDIAPHTLPKTYQDAVLVTKKLHMSYIWIDSLCIIQDDEDDWRRESSVMHEVYANGFCNIAATAAEDGSKGLFFQQDMRVLRPCLLHIPWLTKPGTAYELLNEDFWQYSVLDAPLSRRAWVCQERLLSLWNIHFGREQVLWECRELNAAEKFPRGLLDDGPGIRYLNFKQLDPMIQGPPVYNKDDPEPQDKRLWVYSKWQYVIASYFRGLLTKPEDKLAAISGIAERFRTILQDEYVVGMWRQYLACQLLWRQDDESKFVRPKEYRAPSFSWVSLDGEVDAPLGISNSNIFATTLDVSIEKDISGIATGGYLTISALMAVVKIRTALFGSSYIAYVNNCRLSKNWYIYPDVSTADGNVEYEDDDTEDSDTKAWLGCKYYLHIKQEEDEQGVLDLAEGLILEYLPGTQGHYKRVGYASCVNESLLEVIPILKKGAMFESISCKEYNHETGHHTIRIY